MNVATPAQTTPLVSLTSLPGPTTAFAAVWNYAPAPSILDASVVTTSNLVSNGNTTPVVHYSVDCPTADTPDNNFCRALGFYPAEIHYTPSGSSAAGIWTDAFGHGTTAWNCALGDATCPEGATASPGPGCQAPASASCALTVTNGHGAAAVATELAPFDGCQAGDNSVVLHITAGLEKLGGVSAATWLPTGTWTDVHEYAAAMTSSWDSELAAYGCPSKSVLTDVPEETSGTSTGLATASTTSGTVATGTSSGAVSTGTTAGGSIQTGAAAEGGNAGSLRVVGFLSAGVVFAQLLL